MKIFIIGLMLLTMTACTSKNEYGRCVGYNQEKDPSLKYEVSGWNIFMGVLFFELIGPPIVVFISELECPVERK